MSAHDAEALNSLVVMAMAVSVIFRKLYANVA